MKTELNILCKCNFHGKKKYDEISETYRVNSNTYYKRNEDLTSEKLD